MKQDSYFSRWGELSNSSPLPPHPQSDPSHLLAPHGQEVMLSPECPSVHRLVPGEGSPEGQSDPSK